MEVLINFYGFHDCNFLRTVKRTCNFIFILMHWEEGNGISHFFNLVSLSLFFFYYIFMNACLWDVVLQIAE